MSRVPSALGGSLHDYFLSWWDGSDLDSLQVVALAESGFSAEYIYGFPSFGPDARVWLYVRAAPAYTGETAVLSVDPDKQRWEVYTETNRPLLSSGITCFYIDCLGIKWFATQHGLARFDGETWIRCTTANTGLPDNLVAQMAYDEIDQVYYVVTQQERDSGYASAFSILTPAGQRIGGPLWFPESSLPWEMPIICRDGRGVWWLCPFNTHTVYSYDHDRLMHWQVGDWIDPDRFIGYVGSTTSGRNFCIAGDWSTPLCVMIW